MEAQDIAADVKAAILEHPDDLTLHAYAHKYVVLAYRRVSCGLHASFGAREQPQKSNSRVIRHSVLCWRWESSTTAP